MAVEVQVRTSGTATFAAEFRKSAGEVRVFGAALDKFGQQDVAKTEAAFRSLGLEGVMGFRKLRQAWQETKLTEAMDTLRRSASVSAQDLQRATAAYTAKLAE